jgi:hypothetical protein
MTARAWWCAALVGAACGAGCGGAAAQLRPKAPPLHLEITSGKDTNHGGPLYVVVRKIDQAGFLADDYDAIADRLFAQPPDPAVLRKAIVRPGERVSLNADRDLADGEILGVYFLFSVPDNDWRLAVVDPHVQQVTIVLGPAGILSTAQR